MGPDRVRCGGCLRLRRSADSLERAGPSRCGGRLSPESLARSIKKIAPKLLTLTEPEVSFRKRGSIAVGEGFLPDDLGLPDRRLRNGAAARTDGDYRHRNRRSDDQLRNAASHDRLPSMNAITAT